MGLRVTGVDDSRVRIQAFMRGAKQADRALYASAKYMLDHMRSQYLSGSPLRVRTGKLRSNWQAEPPQQLDASTSQVVVGTNTPYARAQNYGFQGNEYVRAHTRRPPKRGASGPGRPKRGKGGTFLKARRARAEAAAAASWARRRNEMSQAAHGVGLRELQERRRGERRMRGLQGEVDNTLPESIRDKARAGGMVAVRGHGRYMKLRATLYLERALRSGEPEARRIFNALVLRDMVAKL